MINFRYHIVSLMAVFLALAVGIVLGVTLLSDPANETIVNQAQQDRRELQDTRAELTRINALSTYRDAWADRVGPTLTRSALTGKKVAVVAMPDAPARVVTAISDSIVQAGGAVVADVEVSRNVYLADKADDLTAALDPVTAEMPEVGANATLSTKLGLVLGRGVLDANGTAPDAASTEALKALTDARLVTVGDDVVERATLVVVVTAAAPTASDTTTGNMALNHAQTELALRTSGIGVVVAGPNSDNVAGTDVQQIRSPGASADQLSTVDVADLPSGVVTTVLALDEQSLGGQGHYGATGDAVAPDLPIR